ncbi:MAG: hypothetical protein IT200_13305 [Thermoleophilia bacterium]|nr:hypothetical protein [Thermoleophilia bacterium]
MVAATALVVSAATASGRVEGAALLVAGAACAALVLLVTATRLIAPVPAPPRRDGAALARGLGAAGPDLLRFHAEEARRRERSLAAVADLLERRAWWMTAIGAVGLLASAPVWLLPGPDGIVAGACGTIALLLVTAAPVAGLGLCTAAVTGEWAPPVIAPPDPGHPDPVRAMAARRMAAGVVGELVVARRGRITAMMGWLLTAEAALILAVTVAGAGRW